MLNVDCIVDSHACLIRYAQDFHYLGRRGSKKVLRVCKSMSTNTLESVN